MSDKTFLITMSHKVTRKAYVEASSEEEAKEKISTVETWDIDESNYETTVELADI